MRDLDRTAAGLPGWPLVLTTDTGGERWTLAGRPLHAGDALDVLAEGDTWTCSGCHGEGVVAGAACSGCGGRGYGWTPLWIPVRFEYRNAGDGTGAAYLCPRLPGGPDDRRAAIEVRAGDGIRCRWRALAPPSPAEGPAWREERHDGRTLWRLDVTRYGEALALVVAPASGGRWHARCGPAARGTADIAGAGDYLTTEPTAERARAVARAWAEGV